MMNRTAFKSFDKGQDESVDAERAYLKSLYFFVFLAAGFVMPFSGVFFKHVLVHPDGTTADDLIGWIYFFMPLVGILANVPAGILADKLQLGRHLITYLCFATALFTLFTGLAGDAPTSAWPVETRFTWMFIAVMAYYMFSMPIIPTVDGETMSHLNRTADQESYGKIRLFGTLGWSAACIVMGLVLNFYYHLPLVYYGSAFAFLLLGGVSFRGLNFKKRPLPIRIPWEHLKQDRVFVWFLLFAFLNGVVWMTSFMYSSYFFDDVLESPLEMGLVFSTWNIFEIPVMIFSKQLIRKFGNRRLIVFGLLFDGVRLILFSQFTPETSFWWKWSAASLQGAGNGLMQLGTIDFVDRQSHEDLKSTYMNIYSLVRRTLASAVGGKLGAWCIASYGANQLMLITGVGSFVLILFFYLFTRGYRADPGN